VSIESFQVQPIGEISAPFKEKFGIPRQPNLCTIKSRILLNGPDMSLDCLEGIEQHSHIWVLFQFHQNVRNGWKPKVRPPRLGGNDKLGVLATRSSFRPNGIGMSVVKLAGIDVVEGVPNVLVEGLDLVDGTPVVDIKPYVPYADAVVDARSELAQEPPAEALVVEYSEQARLQITQLSSQYPELATLIQQVLQQDPRPSYKKSKLDEKIYGIRLYNLNIRWRVTYDICHVISIAQEKD